MREEGPITALHGIEDWYDPDPQFVEVLSDELRVAIEQDEMSPASRGPSGRRASPWLWSGVVAGLVVAVALGFRGTDRGPELVTEPEVVPTQQAVALPNSISAVCDRLNFAGAAHVASASGQVQPVSYRVSPRVSEALILDMRESLAVVAESYLENPEANPVMAAGLSISIREFALAALYLDMGELAESQRHLDLGRETLAALQADPFFAACFGL